MKARRFAYIPKEFQSQDITWLVMECCPETKGVFIYLHKEPGGPPSFDNWYQSEEIALEAAEESFGIKPEDWAFFDTGKNS